MEIEDQLDLDRARALAALLDLDPGLVREGDILRPMWQLGYFLERPAQRHLGVDGHPRSDRGPGVRRMFAGGRLELRPGLRLGDDVTARTEVVGEREKAGRAGRLVFVTTRTTVSTRTAAGLHGVDRLVDERDLVYLEGPRGEVEVDRHDPVATPVGGVELDATYLFRFSALTYNAHRIHYDAAYARDVEGYPGLVVHGPLQALLMAEAATDALVGPLGFALPGTVRFDYLLTAPLFLGQGLVVTTGEVAGADGGAVTVQAADASGRVTAHGTLRIS
jgi:3-methylfumaryl-CoA hydratase